MCYIYIYRYVLYNSAYLHLLLCVTCLAVFVGTAWPSCFKVLGLRIDRLSLGPLVRQKTKHVS